MEKKSFESADEVRSLDRGRIEVVTVGGHTVGRVRFEPGWRWSENVKPIVQTDVCEAEHLVAVESGRMAVQMKDGTQMEYGPGEIMYIPPGHDAWIVGSEPFVAIDFIGLADYAKDR
jgi:quercetin dioxygenase-like cupin family protein